MGQSLKIKGYSNTKTSIQLPLVNTKFEGSVTFHREGIGLPAYKGQFGFDWMDLTTQQYHKCAGKTKYNNSLKMYEFDPSSTASEFSKLEKEYDIINISGYNNGINTNYYTPWYSARKNSKNTLSLKIKIKNHVDGIIKLEPDDSNIVLNKTQIDIKGKTSGNIAETLEISFSKAISKNAKINAKFYDEAGKQPNGLLIGAINIYKNNIEYDMNLNYVQVYIKGKIKVKGEDNKIYLDPISKKYTYYTEKIDELNNIINKEIPDKIKKLNTKLASVIADPPSSYNIFASNESDIRDDITELNNELIEKNKELVEINRQKKLAEKIDLVQANNLSKSMTDINSKKVHLESIFKQALVLYNNMGVETLEIEASDYKDFFDFWDDIEIYWDIPSSQYMVRYTEGEEYDTSEFKEKTLDAYKNYKDGENYIFLTPLNMHSDKHETHYLGGQAESVSHKGNKAIMLPLSKPAVMIHEIGHVFNLYHTFRNKHINFCKGTIENIMDYSDFEANHPGISTNKTLN